MKQPLFMVAFQKSSPLLKRGVSRRGRDGEIKNLAWIFNTIPVYPQKHSQATKILNILVYDVLEQLLFPALQLQFPIFLGYFVKGFQIKLTVLKVFSFA